MARAGAVGDGRIAQGRRRRLRGLRDVERELEAVPGRLGVGELDLPGHLRVRIRPAQLADDRALGVDAVDAEARRLPLQPVLVVAIGIRVPGHGVGDLRADIIAVAVRAVADPRDADRGVDHRLDDALVRVRRGRRDRPRLARIVDRLAVGAVAQFGAGGIDALAHPGDRRFPRRRVDLRHPPDVERQALAVIVLAADADVLARQGQPGDRAPRALLFRPRHGRLVERHRLGIRCAAALRAGSCNPPSRAGWRDRRRDNRRHRRGRSAAPSPGGSRYLTISPPIRNGRIAQ